VIRYVLALLLVVVVLGMTATALDHAAAARAEQSIEADIETVDAAASDLLEHESPTPNAPGPRRIVELDLPARSYTSAGTERLVFEPLPDAGVTRVRYSVGHRAEETVLLDPLVRHPGSEKLDLSHYQGRQRLQLTLRVDGDGERYVEVTGFGDTDI